MARLGFDRCYVLDDGGPEARPPYLSPVVLAQIGTTAVLLVMLLLATPFWHSTPAATPNRARIAPTNNRIAAQRLP